MRLIARLDIKNDFVIKGIHLEGLRKVGRPEEMAERYYQSEIDELIFMDAVASLYERNNLFHFIEKAATSVFIPIGLGGGLRSLDDISAALDAGADKIIVNTGAVKDISLVERAALKFGSQCIVGSIEAKNISGSYFAFTETGREYNDLEVLAWSRRLVDAGIGELVLTSIDQEGTGRGFDLKLCEMVYESVNVPLIVSGGFGNNKHFNDLFEVITPSAVVIASHLHYGRASVSELRMAMNEALSGSAWSK